MKHRRTTGSMLAAALWALTSLAQAPSAPPTPAPAPTNPQEEVRGTWMTTTANDAISTPAKTAESMRRLRDIGINTVYVEVWKNGYTQFPSKVLKRTVGVDRRPALMKQDPSDSPDAVKSPGRDLLQETLIEAHRQGLTYIAWFEYGFMAAHKDYPSDLSKMKKEWLSRDIKGNEVAPNGFIWMNPLHHEARRFLLDLVLEAVDTYDLDGIQIDDRIVWPYITMGYDDYTRKVYASEHGGKQPPDDHLDESWRRWRSEKVNEYSKQFVQELRAARPGLLISLSPAVYPWCYENYCLEWPKWAAWEKKDARNLGDFVRATQMVPRWDEFVPQCYRFSYEAFERTWLDQVKWMNEMGGGRVKDMMPGIRVVGEGVDAPWDDLRRSIELARRTGAGGHVHWYSRGVFLYEKELTEFYNVKANGMAKHPKWPAGWRPGAIELSRNAERSKANSWFWETRIPEPALSEGTYHVVVRNGQTWSYRSTISVGASASALGTGVLLDGEYDGMIWLRSRMAENRSDAFLGWQPGTSGGSK